MIGKLMLLAALAGGVWLGTVRASDPARTPLRLPVSSDEARARLGAERRLVKGTGLGFLTLAPAGRRGDALLIEVTRANSPARLRCRVTVMPSADAPASFYASASGEPRAGRSDALVDCSQPPSNEPAVQQVGIKAIELVVGEHVIATASDRAYDIDRVSKAMLTLVMLNRAVLAASVMSDD